MGDDGLYRVSDGEGELGFLETLSPRHLALHSIRETTGADRAVRDAVRNSALLDFAWPAGSTFQTIWRDLVLPLMPKRFVKFRFEHRARFEDGSWDGRDDEVEEESDTPPEQRASTPAITREVTWTISVVYNRWTSNGRCGARIWITR